MSLTQRSKRQLRLHDILDWGDIPAIGTCEPGLVQARAQSLCRFGLCSGSHLVHD